ncbi:hypothetical protein H4S04_004829 [Coemansia sp. S16]|nr:hypothetical protein H4S03_006995 [Coemansia sp. S3946]KAJ2046803.1 hypothetical protein H4S04_004829 [Coemansia sp. S16]KAJ2062134.1 hypothetical protein GGI08_002727 [Coemansia sp. S2]KAJ2351258.1 hypothetical protein GGH92_001927 [Coemansia sp. RSA 2673]
MNNNGEPKVPMMVAPPATSATIAPAIDSPAADVPVVNVLTRAEIYAKQLELNTKRLGFNAKQLDLDDKQLQLDEQQRKLDDEQRELNAQSSVSVVFKLMASASARTPAIPVDAPTESISPCPPIAALPSLLVAALPAARPTAAQEGKRPAPINESPESPIAPKRHRGSGQITNDGSATSSSLTTCRSLSKKVAVERLVAALDVPALVAPATGTPIFGNAPAAGALATDYSAVDLSAYFAPTADYSAIDFSALVAPAAGATTFGNAPAVGFSAVDFSAYFAPAAGSTMFDNAPAAGVPALDFSALVTPAAGATTFGNAPAAGVLDRDISDLFAPATSVTTFGNAPAIGFSAADISAYFAPAAGATTFGYAPTAGISAADISAYLAPAAGATMFDNAPVAGVPALDFSALVMPAAGATTFGVAPAIGVPALDFSAHVAPATDASTFGNAPVTGALAGDYSAFAAPAADALAADISAYVAPVDAAQFAAILNADQPIDRHLATQEWVYRASRNNASAVGVPDQDITAAELLRMIYDASGKIYDGSGEQVTSERLLVALGEAPFVGLGYVLDAYSHIYDYELMPSTAPPQECIVTLASVVALEHWAPQLDEEDSESIADLNILCRRDLEIGALRQGFLEELGLAQDSNAAVLGPHLCYVVVRMRAMSVDLLTGPMLRSMFMEVTGLDLRSLTVVTEQGVGQISPNKLSLMVKSWVLHLSKFIADDGNGLEGSLFVATACNTLYATRCSDGSHGDFGVLGARMLMNDELYSKSFLGNQEAKWKALCMCLFLVAGKNTSSYAKEYLRQLAKKRQIQHSSS